MSAEAWPTEAAATKAVDAAARRAFEDSRRETAEATGIPLERYADWDDIGKVVQRQWRERVLSTVWAALSSLPDPRHTAWTLGYVAGQSDGAFEAAGSGEDVVYPHENPYPTGL